MTDKIAQLEARIIELETDQKRYINFIMMELARLQNRAMNKQVDIVPNEYIKFFMLQLGKQGQEHVELLDRLKPVFKVLKKQIKSADRVTPPENGKQNDT